MVDALADDQLRALLAACRGAELRDRRDEAVVRLMVETGLRAGEVIAMTVPDVDLAHGGAVIHRGKGGKGRVIPHAALKARAAQAGIAGFPPSAPALPPTAASPPAGRRAGCWSRCRWTARSGWSHRSSAA